MKKIIIVFIFLLSFALGINLKAFSKDENANEKGFTVTNFKQLKIRKIIVRI